MKARSAAVRNDCLIKERFVYGNTVRQERGTDTRKAHANVLVGLTPIAMRKIGGERLRDVAPLEEVVGGKLRE